MFKCVATGIPVFVICHQICNQSFWNWQITKLKCPLFYLQYTFEQAHSPEYRYHLYIILLHLYHFIFQFIFLVWSCGVIFSCFLCFQSLLFLYDIDFLECFPKKILPFSHHSLFMLPPVSCCVFHQSGSGIVLLSSVAISSIRTMVPNKEQGSYCSTDWFKYQV